VYPTEKIGKIHVTAKAKDGKIYLRWAADDMFILEQGLKHGFIVRRQTILINNIVQQFSRTVYLNHRAPFLPKPLEQWEEHLDDDNFAIAAQALYGETFEVGYSTNPFMQAAPMLPRPGNYDLRFTYILPNGIVTNSSVTKTLAVQ
jgi:hypothetical protein